MPIAISAGKEVLMKRVSKRMWMRAVSRFLTVCLMWMNLGVAPAFAEMIPTRSFQDLNEDWHWEYWVAARSGIHPGTVPVTPETLERLQAHRPDPALQYGGNGNPQDKEGYNIFTEVGQIGGFMVTFSTVLAGYLVLYLPLGSYAGTMCMFDDEGWNDCWNDYMNRVFH